MIQQRARIYVVSSGKLVSAQNKSADTSPLLLPAPLSVLHTYTCIVQYACR